MHIYRSILRSMFQAAAATLLVAGTVATAPAQATSSQPATPYTVALATAPVDMFAASTPSYSSSAVSSEAVGEEMNFGGDANQPPPRRTYGRPRYSDSHTNADGSSKYTGILGVGMASPVSVTSQDLTLGYKFQAGVGRNFNKNFGVMFQFDYDHFGFQQSTLNTLIKIYNGPSVQAGLTSLSGSSHVWSFTLDPMYTISSGDKWGTYLVGTVGFYHKVADFTTPGTGYYYDPYYGYIQYTANEVIDSYVSNAPGFGGGGGITYKFSRFSGERFYVEGRYIWVANSARSYIGTTTANTPSTGTAFDAFPQNGNRTTFIPITVGVRF